MTEFQAMLQYARQHRAITTGIIVAALGFFVDLYDIIIFSAERTDSFTDLGIPETDWPADTALILNMQMFGMLVGGFIWGTIGDKFGRLKVLFGSILVYSVFTLANAFVTTIPQYMWCRFLAGLGLAGELGAGITLVSEQVDKRFRGFAVSLVGGIGMFGAVTAGIVANLFSWKTSYIIGAGLGFVLLLLRFGVYESGLFDSMKHHTRVEKGNFLIILRNRDLLRKFICVLLVGMPGWFSTGILITFTREISGSMGMDPLPVASTVITLNFLTFAFGDPLCGLLSQRLKSRKLAIRAFLILFTAMMLLFFTVARFSTAIYYALFMGIGISVGYTIMLFTLAAEQFGTNVRTLVTSTSLNLTRAWVIPLSLAFTGLATLFGSNYYLAALLLAATSLVLAFWALSQLEETYHKDMDFVET